MEKILSLLVVLLLTTTIKAQQQELQLTLSDVDSLLQTNSLSQITFHFNIDAAKAQETQAKLFENPLLSTEWNLYNPTKKSFFDVGPTGQKAFSIQQVFKIAGQRNKTINLAKEQTRLTEYEYYDLARTLKFEARSNFYTIYFLNNTLNNIDHQLALLYETIQAYKKQYDKGNVSLKDYARLQASYYAFNNNRSDIIRNRADAQQALKTILGVAIDILPAIDSTQLSVYTLNKINPSVADSLAFYRPDVLAIETITRVNERNLSYQRSLSKPNLFLGASYDQAGSYINNYTALTAGFQIPIFNRNQGNIAAAKAYLKQSQVNYQLKKLEAYNEWMAAYYKLQQLDAEFKKIDIDFKGQLDLLSRNLIINYTKSNISLLEFTDLFESYNEALIQINNLSIERISAFEELNYLTGKEIIINH